MTIATLGAPLLADGYHLKRRLALGGASEVYEAFDTRLERTVAVKVLMVDAAANDPLPAAAARPPSRRRLSKGPVPRASCRS